LIIDGSLKEEKVKEDFFKDSFLGIYLWKNFSCIGYWFGSG